MRMRFSPGSPVFPCHHQSTDISYSLFYLYTAIYNFRKYYLLTYLLIYLLTPWSKVLLEKLTGSQLKKFPEFYETRRFITALTRARHLSLSWATLGPTKVCVQAQSTCISFVTSSIFTARSCWHLAQTHSVGQPLVGCPRLLIQYIRSYPPYWRPSLHPQPEDAPCRDDSAVNPLEPELFFFLILAHLYTKCE